MIQRTCQPLSPLAGSPEWGAQTQHPNVIGQDLHDVVIAVVPGLLAVLEGVGGAFEHWDCVLFGADVEEVTHSLGEIVGPNGLPGLRITYHLNPFLDDDGLAMIHPCREHVLLGDVHAQRLFHHPSDAEHFRR